MIELNQLYNMDCMDGMAQFADNYFELAIVDPPYGGGSENHEWDHKKRGRFGGLFDKYEIKGKCAKNKTEHWDIAPPPEYFDELFRVSRNQIIWGGNYFDLPPTRCFAIWRKLTISESFSMAMCEYAWTSFNQNAKWIEITPQGTQAEPRFHPTQKPVALYSWLLGQYANPGDKILDTHAGSASSLVACYDGGYDFIGFEIDKEYFEKANERLLSKMSQRNLFR